ncbi:MAG: glycosyltransferase family 1 protein [Candidatus Jordarchaeales archaeon]
MIVLVTHDPSQGGILRYSYSLFNALRRISDKIDFIITPSTFIKAPALEALKPVYGMKNYALVKLFAHSVSKKNASIYHILNATISGFFNLNPFILTVHDLMPFTLFKERARSWANFGWLFLLGTQRSMRLGISKAERIICISESAKHDLLQFINVDSEKVRVIHHGVDHDLFKPRDKPEVRKRLRLPLDKPIILNVASEEPRKNIPTLLKAFKRLLSEVPDALLVRVGEKTAEVNKIIDELGLRKNIVYLRPGDTDLACLYNASDLFVFPSYYEGLGLPLLEAMSSGCPVIAGNRSAVPEVVGDAGILLDPFDIDGFAYWMREVLTNEDLRAKLSEAGYKRSLSFSWEKCAKETLEVYREVLNEF